MSAFSSKYLIDEPALQVLPSLAVKFGLNEAIVLQQVHYWTTVSERKGIGNNYRDGRWWVYRPYREWHSDFPFWSMSTIRRILNDLEDMGVIISIKGNKASFDQTKFYAVDYDCLNAIMDDTNDVAKLDSSSDPNKSMCPNCDDGSDYPVGVYSDQIIEDGCAEVEQFLNKNQETKETEINIETNNTAKNQESDVSKMSTSVGDSPCLEWEQYEREVMGDDAALIREPSRQPADPPDLGFELDKNKPPPTPHKPRTADELRESTAAALNRFYEKQGKTPDVVIHADLSFVRDDLRPLAEQFVTCFGRGPTRAERSRWAKEFEEWGEMRLSAQDIALAYDRHRQQGLTVKSPGSLTAIAYDESQKARERASGKRTVPPGASEVWVGNERIA